MKRYDETHKEVTQSLLKEIDGFITESFQPDSVTPEQVRAEVDALLERKKGDLLNNPVFITGPRSGRFMIVGIELWRGGGAINENAVSFRAYKESQGKFEYVTSTAALSDTSESAESQALTDLHADVLTVPPVLGEFWFIAWADVPPLAPYKITMRVYAFDGKNFRTVWTPENIIASDIDNAVQLTPDGRGFIVNQMPDFQSQFVIHKEYYLKPDGPHAVSESTSERQ